MSGDARTHELKDRLAAVTAPGRYLKPGLAELSTLTSFVYITPIERWARERNGKWKMENGKCTSLVMDHFPFVICHVPFFISGTAFDHKGLCVLEYGGVGRNNRIG